MLEAQVLATKVLQQLQPDKKNGMAHLRDPDIRELALELLNLIVSSDLHLCGARLGLVAEVMEGE